MKKLKQLILAVVIFMTCGVAFAINFDSMAPYPQFVSWEVEGSTQQPIKFIRGNTINMYFCAEAPCDIMELNMKIEIILMGVTQDIPLPKKADEYLHNCRLPIRKGDILYVQLPINVKTTAPSITGHFAVKLDNEYGECIAGEKCGFKII